MKSCGRYIIGLLTNKANIIIQYYLDPYCFSTDSKTRGLEWPFCVKFYFTLVYLELWSLAFEAWQLLNLQWMLSASFESKITAMASHGFPYDSTAFLLGRPER